MALEWPLLRCKTLKEGSGQKIEKNKEILIGAFSLEMYSWTSW